MKFAETFKNAIKNGHFLSAREARRENFGNLRWKVSDLGVSQALDKYPLGCPQEKNYSRREQWPLLGCNWAGNHLRQHNRHWYRAL